MRLRGLIFSPFIGQMWSGWRAGGDCNTPMPTIWHSRFSGPSDIYAMGVPKDSAINDRRHVKTENGEEIKAFLAEYVKA
ncbi:MAG: hypothetical protein MUC83_13875 [Pirellula sp.]|nr:hypothetical protein [Pirellula sp.]